MAAAKATLENRRCFISNRQTPSPSPRIAQSANRSRLIRLRHTNEGRVAMCASGVGALWAARFHSSPWQCPHKRAYTPNLARIFDQRMCESWRRLARQAADIQYKPRGDIRSANGATAVASWLYVPPLIPGRCRPQTRARGALSRCPTFARRAARVQSQRRGARQRTGTATKRRRVARAALARVWTHRPRSPACRGLIYCTVSCRRSSPRAPLICHRQLQPLSLYEVSRSRPSP
jgi:hypothetical protein